MPEVGCSAFLIKTTLCNSVAELAPYFCVRMMIILQERIKNYAGNLGFD